MTPAFQRWLLLTAASCLVIAAAINTIEREEISCPFGICGFSPQRGVRTQLFVTSANIRRLASSFRDASDMALAARVLPRGRPAGNPDVWFAPDIRDLARMSVQAAVNAERKSRGPWHGKGRVAVLVISDTARQLAGRQNNHGSASVAVRAILPSAETDWRCVAVVRLRNAALTDGINWTPARPLLDACAFFDAFGEPGAAIRATLDSGAFSAARLYLPAPPDSVLRLRIRNAVFAYEPDAEADVYRCSAGQIGVCDTVMLAGASRRRARDFYYSIRMQPATSLPVTTEGDVWWAGALMDAIAADLGPDRFAKFWQSPKPMADAYREVSGRPIGMVAYEQIRAGQPQLQPTKGFGVHSETTLPATLGSTALLLLAIGALAGLAVRASRRPTVA